MASTISKSYIEQYKKNVILLAQQKGSKQRTTVNTTDVKGRSSYVEAIGSVDVEPITTRHAATPILDTPFERRQLLLEDFAWGDMIDDVDRIRMLIDPTSTYIKAAGYAFGRKMDNVINTALLGPARAGMTGSSTVILPASQKVGNSSDISLDLATLLEIKSIFDNNDVDPDQEKYILISPTQLTTLLSETEVTSSDYVTVKALVQGQIDSYLGFKFIMTNRLELDGDDKRHCIAYTKDALTLGIGLNPRVEMAKDPGRSFNLQIYMAMSLGAVRVEEKKVVEALIKE